MKFGYFFDGTEALKQALEKERDLKYIVLSKVSIPIIIVTICFMWCGVYQIKDRSEKITRGIITLYETLEDIQNQKDGTAKTVLSFKKSALELNELHLTFNKVARTTMLTSGKNSDETEKELLNYSEALLIFKEFKDEK